jgi:hypothetical protein
MQLQVLAGRAAPVDAGLLRHVADRAAHRARVANCVVPSDRRRPGIRLRQRYENADRRRFAGAVRSE